MLHHHIVDFLGVLGPLFLLVVGVIVLALPVHCLNEGGVVRWVIGNSMVGSLSSQTASVAKSPSYLRQFMRCSEMALMLRLKVDAALVAPVLSKMICSRP